MNIAKNMEAVFIAAIALVAATSFAAAPFEGRIQVVTIVGKRLRARESQH
jgi:hypothetical protein